MLLSNPLKLDRSLTPLDLSRFTDGLYKGRSQFLISFLSIYKASSPPKTTLTHLQPLPQGFFKLIQVFLHLVGFKFLIFMHFMLHAFQIPHFHAFHALFKFFGISAKFRVFQNQRGFLILKTSCIASHEHYNSIVMHLDV